MFLNWVIRTFVPGWRTLMKRAIKSHFLWTGQLTESTQWPAVRNYKKQSGSERLRLKKCSHVKLIQEWPFLCLEHGESPRRPFPTLHLFTPEQLASVTSDNGSKIDSNSPPVNRGQQRGGQQFLSMFAGGKMVSNEYLFIYLFRTVGKQVLVAGGLSWRKANMDLDWVLLISSNPT